MSKADKMFEELGYKKSYTQLNQIKSYKDDDNVIYFDIERKSFNKVRKYVGMCDDITMEELKVINEKVSELRVVK